MEKLKNLFRNMDGFTWILVIVLLAQNMLNSSMGIGQWLLVKAVTLPGIIIGLTFHEFSHGFVSYKLGDPTPKAQGRLTLNPAHHIDIIGFFFLLIAGFGWGEPVQIDPRYYRNRRRDEFFVAIAGVTMNLIIAIVFSFITKGMYNIATTKLLYIVYLMCYYTVQINLVLMVFNLIPCPPLDGFNILTQILDLQKYNWWYPLYKKGNLILMFLILLNITSRIIGPAVSGMMDILF